MTTSINISSCFDNPQNVLRSAFDRRNVDAFKHALEQLNANPNLKQRNLNEKTVFEEVLTTANSSTFIGLCIDNGADVYARNSSGKYPLHYVIDSLSPENLRTFLTRYDPNRINVRYGYKNCLHMLMEILSNKHLNQDNIAECIKILIESGCSINMPNEKSRTPLFMLFRAPDMKHKKDLLEFIAKNCDMDLYSYKSKEMLDLFKKNYPHLEVPQPITNNVDFDYMRSLLKLRSEEKFIANFKLFKEVETSKLKSHENNQNNSNKFGEDCARLLYAAVEENLENVVEHLVDEGIDVSQKPTDINQTNGVAHIACLRGNFRILETLLRADPKPELVNDRNKNLIHVATEHFGMDPNKNPSYSYEKCFYLALNYCDISQQDDLGCTPLHYAARYRNEKAVIELLRRGCYIGTKSILNDETAIENISYDALETYLNECITTIARPHGNQQQDIKISYNFLMAPKKKNEEFNQEIAPLHSIALNPELRPLIRHPVLSSFLYLKWTKLAVLFHVNLFMFAIFMASLIYYIVLCQSLSPEEQQESFVFAFCRLLSIICVITLALREIFQFILSPRLYVKSIVNYFEVILIFLGVFLIFEHNYETNATDVHLRILRAVTILFAAYEFLQLVGSLPYLSISTHMVILKKVALTFFKSLLLYSILLLSFALSFYSLFGGKGGNAATNSTETNDKEPEKEEDVFNSFGYPGIAIIKTFVMLTGEFDASALDLDRNGAYSIIFLLFVFLITIVLFNLLNALAIDDTHQIRVEGELIDFCERISMLNKYENVLLSQSNSWKWIKRFISIFPYTIPNGKIVIHPDVNNKIFTYKMASSNKDVSINIGDEQELQNLNNNIALKTIIPSQRLSDELQNYSSRMDPKIMKKIRIILEERKQMKNEDESALINRIGSMESEIKILKASITKLCDLIAEKNIL